MRSNRISHILAGSQSDCVVLSNTSAHKRPFSTIQRLKTELHDSDRYKEINSTELRGLTSTVMSPPAVTLTFDPKT